MSEDKEYNGWTNKETWLCNLWFDNAFKDAAKECETLSDLADRIKSMVEEHIEEQTSESSFVADLVGVALSKVNWYDIAEHYEEFLSKPEDDEDEDVGEEISCDRCQMLSINGVACHETGCPNMGARWDSDSQTWIKQRKCFDCGCTVDADDPCCSQPVEDEEAE